jgi:hypothetical protein
MLYQQHDVHLDAYRPTRLVRSSSSMQAVGHYAPDRRISVKVQPEQHVAGLLIKKRSGLQSLCHCSAAASNWLSSCAARMQL